jgi:hypothetical protein
MVDSNSNVDIEFSANYAFLGWPSQGSHKLKRFFIWYGQNIGNPNNILITWL